YPDDSEPADLELVDSVADDCRAVPMADDQFETAAPDGSVAHSAQADYSDSAGLVQAGLVPADYFPGDCSGPVGLVSVDSAAVDFSVVLLPVVLHPDVRSWQADFLGDSVGSPEPELPSRVLPEARLSLLWL